MFAFILLVRDAQTEQYVRNTPGISRLWENAGFLLVQARKQEIIDTARANPTRARVLPSYRVSIDRVPQAIWQTLGITPPADAKTLYDVLVDLVGEDMMERLLSRR